MKTLSSNDIIGIALSGLLKSLLLWWEKELGEVAASLKNR